MRAGVCFCLPFDSIHNSTNSLYKFDLKEFAALRGKPIDSKAGSTSPKWFKLFSNNIRILVICCVQKAMYRDTHTASLASNECPLIEWFVCSFVGFAGVFDVFIK